MTALAMDNYTGAPDELLEQARKVARTPESAALMLAAVNRRLAELAPGEEPFAAAKRLTVERDSWAIESGYKLLMWYYDKSLSPEEFKASFEEIDREEYVWLAEGLLDGLKDGNG